MSEFKPRKPDYTMSALDKKTGTKGPIGAAWKNDDGTITIRINPFVVINTVEMELVVMLYSTNEKKSNTYTKSRGRAPREEDSDAREGALDIDEIPF